MNDDSNPYSDAPQQPQQQYYNYGYGYQPPYPTPAQTTPGAVTLFRVLAVIMIVSGLLSIIGGVMYLYVDPSQLLAQQFPKLQVKPLSYNDRIFAGVTNIGMGGLTVLAFAAMLLLPRRPWVWVLGIVSMALSLLSCCCMAPLTIVTLVFWCMKPTRAWYGMETASQYPQTPSQPGAYSSYAPYAQQQQPPREPWRE